MRVVVPLLCVLTLCVVMSESSFATPIPTQAVYTNKSRFRIPYRYDEKEIRRLKAKEIRLYASLDFGGQWQHVSSVAPGAEHFEFTAKQDGEYWFAVRTLSGSDRLYPEGGFTEPGLRVIVDTLAPQFDITVRQFTAGKIHMNWSASDPYLDLTKLRLEYIQPGLSSWQQVSVTPEASGQTTWSVSKGGLVAVRGTISDRAQNVARSQSQVTIERADLAVPKPSVPEFRTPIAQKRMGRGTLTSLYPQFPKQPDRRVDTPDVASRSATMNQQMAERIAAALERAALTGYDIEITFERGAVTLTGEVTTSQERVMVTEVVSDVPGVDMVDNRLSLLNTPQQPDPIAADPFVQQRVKNTVKSSAPSNQFVSSNTSPPTSVSPLDGRSAMNVRSQTTTPQNVERRSGRQRAVRSGKFKIEYRFDEVGSSGISRVELFVTQDGGQKWWKYGDDPDCQSPFDVEVPGDGTYGFALRARSGVGLANDPPQSGEEPAMVILVDQSPPVVKLMPLQQGEGTAQNKILLRWKISDQNPAEKPVSLSYSANRSGPWEPITGWLPDTGSFVWTVTAGVPSKLYIRLVARDAIGNTSRVETPHPILVDLKKPSARIVDIQAVERR